MEVCVGTIALMAIAVIAILVIAHNRKRRAAEQAEIEEHQRRVWFAQQQQQAAQARFANLVARFGDENARRIVAGEIWQGQTGEMLIEARGRPVDTDEKVMKTKTKATFKYDQRGANRY